jgi:hypothetical protein
MRIVASGSVYDGRDLGPYQRSCAFTAVALAHDGTLYVTCRRGSRRVSLDGHECVFASADLGATWELRYDGYGKSAWDGVPGTIETLLIAETAPGELTATGLWVDRSGGQVEWANPVTQGLLPMRTFLTTSRDGGRTWGSRRPVDLAPHPGPSPTGPLLRLPGALAQPYEHWKEYEDASPGRPEAHLRLSPDDGLTWLEHVTVAADPTNTRFYWDQRLAVQPATGRLVAMFWTHGALAGQDVDIHIAWGSPDGRRWSEPRGTGLPGQHCQPIPLGGERLLAAYVHRRDPPGIHVALSTDFGQTWDRSREMVIYASTAGTEQGAAGPREIGDYWVDMGAWRLGHPRGVLLPSGEVFVVYYAGTRETLTARWARLAV